jgi:hypothetical protein
MAQHVQPILPDARGDRWLKDIRLTVEDGASGIVPRSRGGRIVTSTGTEVWRHGGELSTILNHWMEEHLEREGVLTPGESYTIGKKNGSSPLTHNRLLRVTTQRGTYLLNLVDGTVTPEKK